MPWFPQLCRNLGLTVHHVIQPVKDYNKTKTVVNQTVEEKQLNATTTLRRTTIDEIEITPPGNDPRNDPRKPPGNTSDKTSGGGGGGDSNN